MRAADELAGGVPGRRDISPATTGIITSQLPVGRAERPADVQNSLLGTGASLEREELLGQASINSGGYEEIMHTNTWGLFSVPSPLQEVGAPLSVSRTWAGKVWQRS